MGKEQLRRLREKYDYASVAELVDALDSKSSSFESVGSIPTRGTKNLSIDRFFIYLTKVNIWAFFFQEKRLNLLSPLQKREH